MAARKSNQQSLDQQRKQFVAAKVAQGVSRDTAKQQFYVQTRVKELKAAGKEVTPAVRAQLRQNWQAGNVKRAEFGAPKKAGDNGGSSPKPTVRTGSETSSYTSGGVVRRQVTRAVPYSGTQEPGTKFGNPPKQPTMFKWSLPVMGETKAFKKWDKEIPAWRHNLPKVKRK